MESQKKQLIMIKEFGINVHDEMQEMQIKE